MFMCVLLVSDGHLIGLLPSTADYCGHVSCVPVHVCVCVVCTYIVYFTLHVNSNT